MKPKNRYSVRSKISEAKFRELVKLFALDLDAQRIAFLTGLNRNTINRYLRLIRKRMAHYCERDSPLQGQIEVDECYFGPRRVRGVVGRGALKKVPVLGILQRDGKVYTQVVPNVSRKTIQAVIMGRVNRESDIHSDYFTAYDGLVDLGYRKHYRIHHGKGEFAREKNHINGIESFWSFAKRRLAKFHGAPKNMFYLHLKECEFRFNFRDQNLYQAVLKLCRQKPLC
jgi:transposase-like protein